MFVQSRTQHFLRGLGSVGSVANECENAVVIHTGIGVLCIL